MGYRAILTDCVVQQTFPHLCFVRIHYKLIKSGFLVYIFKIFLNRLYGHSRC